LAAYGTVITWMRGELLHFEILVEDQSGKKALDILVPKIIDENDTFKVYPYKGLGRIPRGLQGVTDPCKRILLDQLPRILRGFGVTFDVYSRDNYTSVVIVVCDLDDKCLKKFRQELYGILDSCNPKPETRFCFAIEEGEAWLLGDIPAIRTAYPKVKLRLLHTYVNDSICGTWEKLADAIYPGGSRKLSTKGWQIIGKEKSEWATKISPHMNVDNNESPSFCYFREKIRELTDTQA